jgi:hypothetical protein
MPQINGIETTAIAGLGQIGVTPTPTYPSGGLVVNSGDLRPDLAIRSGIVPATGSNYFYSRPGRMDSASLGTSNWTKIVSNDQATFFLSSSGELYAMGGANSSIYTGTGKSDTLAKVTTGSNWTDIAAGLQFAIGICDGKLFGIGTNGNGQFGRGNTTNNLSNFGVINGNTFWTKVSCGNAFTMAISGSGGSGSIFSAGSNSSGRTGQNTTVGNTLTFTQPVGFTGNIFTDVSCGEDFALAISNSRIFGTGEAGDYTLGNNSTVDRTTFGLVSSASTFTRVFAFTDFSKAIGTTGSHFHTGNENNTRGDGVGTTQLTTWTQLNTASAAFSASWSNFFSYHLSIYSPGVIGINSNRPYYIGNPGGEAEWMPSSSWGQYNQTTVTTWTPFVSGSPNVTCSAAAFAAGPGGITEPVLMLQLLPIS